MKRRFYYFVVIASLWVSSSFAKEIDWDPKNRKPIREGITTCQVMLAPNEKPFDDSVGIRLATELNPKTFRESLITAIQERGREVLDHGEIYLTGVKMAEEKRTRRDFQEVLDDLGLPHTKLKVLSIPDLEVQKSIRGISKSLLEWMLYYLPSSERDLQKPLLQEVIAGLASDAIVETPMIATLITDPHLTSPEKALTAIIHTVVLGTSIVYGKSISNWIHRPSPIRANQTPFQEALSASLRWIAEYSKSGLLSMPFILNFNLSENGSKIVNLIQQKGYEGFLQASPHAIETFLQTQGLSAVLHTFFYSVAYNGTVIKWANSEEGVDQSRMARTITKVVLIVPLILDSLALYYAATGNSVPVLGDYFTQAQIGPLIINSGHLLLLGITGFFYATFNAGNRFLLNRSLDSALAAEAWYKRNVAPQLQNCRVHTASAQNACQTFIREKLVEPLVKLTRKK